MKRLAILFLCFIAIMNSVAMEKNIPLYWISTSEEKVNEPNTWIAFRKDIVLDKVPRQAIASIAADTKYWLWINGEPVVFEGGLKRGPNPHDTYYDKVDLSAHFKKGENKIAVLLWHFGKDGFSHVNSGSAGLLFHLDIGKTAISSNKDWLCRIHPAYRTTGKPVPNYRLPESNIRFDAQKDIPQWQTAPLNSHSMAGFKPAREIGTWGDAPWNKLVERPIPQWKDFGIKETTFERRSGNGTDTIIVTLPYNMQMTPVITVNDPVGGQLIGIATDHSYAGGTHNLRAEYITRKGVQEYESYGWLNGEKILLTVPSIVEVSAIKYRQTGYDATPEGAFECSDDFYNRFWDKALCTLYVNMRDNYFDCPDRERAQWWGDVVLMMGQSFYTYSTAAHNLMAKAIRELIGWQREDGVLHAPIPGNYKQELPGQILASIGYYGFWNYYINTGDRRLLEEMYPAVKKYLSLWKTDESGLTELRKGGWFWGDWGSNKDMHLIMAGWHHIALKGAALMAEELGYTEDATLFRSTMERVKEGYNKCWNGYAYRHPSYQESTDDRVQALAVISGIADETKYKRILNLFKTQFHASPYMEKYVMEALFVMGEGEYALERTKKRFEEMVDDPNHTTLYEGWGIGKKGFGGGTTNHAWSGGAQIVISQHLFGIKPLEVGYKTFLIEPCPASFTSGTLSFPTVRGTISASFKNNPEEFSMKLHIPKGTTAIVRLSEQGVIRINGKQKKATTFKLVAGKYTIYSAHLSTSASSTN